MVFTFNRNRNYKKYTHYENFSVFRVLYYNQNVLTKLFSLFVLILPHYIFKIAKCDVLMVYGSRIIGFQLAIMIAKLFKKKVVFQSLLHGVDDMATLCSGSRTKKWAYRSLFNRVVYFAINKQFKDRFLHCFSNDNKLVFESTQGVNTDCFKPISNDKKETLKIECGLPIGMPLFLTVGFLIDRKKQKEIFEALEKIEAPFFLLVIGELHYGKGHFLYKKQNETDEIIDDGIKRLRGRIRFQEFVQDIEKYIQASDGVIHNSIEEGLPNVILETMSCGNLIIAKKNPSIPWLKHNNNCLMYQSTEELSEWVQQILENPQGFENVKERARNHILVHESFEAVTQKLFNCIDVHG